MKTAFLFLFVLMCSLPSQAQEVYLDDAILARTAVHTKSAQDQIGIQAAHLRFLGGAKPFRFMFGFRAGAATSNIAADEVLFENDGRRFQLLADEKEFSYHLGMFAQFRISSWVIQPEVLFRSARSDYMLSEFVSAEFITSIRTETYSYVDVPLMVAYRIGALRLQAGPVAKFYIASTSELFGIADFEESYEDVDFGYQVGIGLDIWRFIVDLKYDGDLNKVGDHITFAGEPVDFGTHAGRFLFSVGYSLRKP